jgi:3'(2'), 5'-bisphosphate nucleotidase
VTLNVGLDLIRQVRDIARRAGAEIMDVYGSEFRVEAKADASPVTEADRRAETLITAAIRAEISDRLPIVAEEATARGQVPDISDRGFWLVDPLDGTKEFVKRAKEFTVNIALIELGRPVLGVVYLPALDTIFWGSRHGAFTDGGGGPERRIFCRPAPGDGLLAIVSRSHRTPETDAFLERLPIKREISAGSSMKFCRVAMGSADIYPRFGRTMEWDTAAGHAVLRFAGGRVEDLESKKLTYGKPGFENPHFIARGADAADGSPSNLSTKPT